MGKTLSDIDNHKNSLQKGFFGGSIAATGSIGSTLAQLKDVMPFIIVGGVVLLAMVLG